jgi:hypothetical protein
VRFRGAIIRIDWVAVHAWRAGVAIAAPATGCRRLQLLFCWLRVYRYTRVHYTGMAIKPDGLAMMRMFK